MLKSAYRMSRYGVKWPHWWVYLRGLWWVKRGYCPSCYSSPPRKDCPVCQGSNDYGPRMLHADRRDLWRLRWKVGDV